MNGLMAGLAYDERFPAPGGHPWHPERVLSLVWPAQVCQFADVVHLTVRTRCRV